MRVDKMVILLSTAVALLGGAAAGVGLLWDGSGAAWSTVSIHGDAVLIYGHGLYRFDNLITAAGFRGVDLVTLVVGVPLLGVGIVGYQRGSLRGGLLLLGALAFFLYNSASLALGAAYNELFLVYVALLGCSLAGLVLTVRAIDATVLDARIADGFPRRATAAFLFVLTGVFVVVWLVPAVAALVSAAPPPFLDTYTTVVTWVLDLGVVMPASLAAGVLLLRREPAGYLVAAPILIITLMLGPALTSMTIAQLWSGISFTPAELVGPVIGFLVASAVGAILAVRLLRSVADPSSPVGGGAHLPATAPSA